MGVRYKIAMSLLVPFMIIGYVLLSHFTVEWKKQDQLFEKQANRKSICFLLGEDKGAHQYFKLAEEHFLFDEVEKTDVLIKSCRSIEDMIVFLNSNKEDVSWSTIQVVLHGNPWNGLSLPIVNDGPRASPKKLVKAIMDNPLPKLTTESLDSSTRINFWGCGIGKNPFIEIALDTFFALPKGGKPKIYASPHFVIFKSVGGGIAAKRIKASYWPYFFKRGYRPSNSLIVKELKNQYPEIKIDWNEAVGQNEEIENEGIFQNSFHLPVSWTLIYPSKESRPSVKTAKEKMNWINSQPELLAQIEELDIPIDKFHWTVNKIIHTDAEGNKVPAIKGIGMATIMCVMNEV